MSANRSARRYYAERLREAAALTGDCLLARAAAILDPRPPGRVAIDDSLVLERMAVLIEAHPELPIYGVALRVAGELDEPMLSRRSTAQRLAGKFKRALALAEG